MDSSRRILVAVDASENSLRAIDYVGQIVGGRDDFEITLLHIVPQAVTDLFDKEEVQKSFQEQIEAKESELMERCRQRLLAAGAPEASIRTLSLIKDCPSLSECIIEERRRENFGTIVVGRRGLSRTEEVLYGSVSSSIIHHADKCAIWVVA